MAEFKSDIEIARSVTLEPIVNIAEKFQIPEEYIDPYGKYKAKIDYRYLDELQDKPQGKLVLVTAINPTPAGEGKTTTTVGLGDALNILGENVAIAIREPSLGPVFGVKGGAAGGGHAQVVPMEDINLHFTGDLHAIGAANNLLAALIDNHIQQGNELGIDPRRITWRRGLDMNDRALRNVVIGLGGPTSGMPRQDGFNITVASEIMAILCLATDLKDLKRRLANIVIGYNFDNEPVRASDLKAQGAMAALLKEALKPNLVQTLEHTPAFIHGGPFANIAHGCNSIMATKMALSVADIVVTEAGFGADLGAEKFCNIKCRDSGIAPDAVVVVATIRALKYNGGVAYADLQTENIEALKAGLPNLLRHLDNMKDVFGLPVTVAINAFPTDTEEELKVLQEECKKRDINAVLYEGWAKGGEGGKALAEEVLKLVKQENHFKPSYDVNLSIKEKIEKVVKDIYHGTQVDYSVQASKEIEHLEAMGYGKLPICIAKTQYSFTDDPLQLGAPEDFSVHIKDVRLSAGAGFVVVLTGDIMTMPGLPKVPAANQIDVLDSGEIIGLF